MCKSTVFLLQIRHKINNFRFACQINNYLETIVAEVQEAPNMCVLVWRRARTCFKRERVCFMKYRTFCAGLLADYIKVLGGFSMHNDL